MLVLGDMFIDGTDATGTHARHGGPYETRVHREEGGSGMGRWRGLRGESETWFSHTLKLQASVGFLESIKSLGFWT